MTAPRLLDGLHAVAERYDALLCDVWGVAHDGTRPFARGCDALARFAAERGPVVLVSNSPRPGEDVRRQLDALGVPREAWSGVVTSGDATRQALAARAPGPVWAIGPVRDAPLYEGMGMRFVETPQEAAFVSCTGLFDDDVETPGDFAERLKVCVDRGLVMICANPDRIVMRGDTVIPCAGALADIYVAYGGEVVMAGKPYPPIYTRAYAELARLTGREIPRDRLLAVGDGLRTDVAGANAQGLNVLFTAASGVDATEVLDADGDLSMARTTALLASVGAQARYVMAELAW